MNGLLPVEGIFFHFNSLHLYFSLSISFFLPLSDSLPIKRERKKERSSLIQDLNIGQQERSSCSPSPTYHLSLTRPLFPSHSLSFSLTFFWQVNYLWIGGKFIFIMNWSTCCCFLSSLSHSLLLSSFLFLPLLIIIIHFLAKERPEKRRRSE